MDWENLVAVTSMASRPKALTISLPTVVLWSW